MNPPAGMIAPGLSHALRVMWRAPRGTDDGADSKPETGASDHQRRQPVDRYPNISDHGLIGDLQTAALVTTDGTVDWFCTPRFDSPSVFASLLDADKGGYMRVPPATDKYVSRQL